MPDPVLLLDLARAGHVAGLAAGLGLALVADLVALRSLVSPVGPTDVWMLRCLHRLILGGLGLLWVSGLCLLWLRTGFEASQFSPKLITKLVVVALLSLNALAIGGFALPRYAMYQGRLFCAFPLGDRLRLSVIAGLSLCCWLSALALGVFSHLKPMSFQSLEAVFVPLFLAGLAGALVIGFGARAFAAFASPPRDGWTDAPLMRRTHSRMLGL